MAQEIETSIHGSRFGLGPNNQLIAQDPHAPGGPVTLASALHPGCLMSKNVVYDDFMCPILDVGKWTALKGSDGGAAYPVIVAGLGGTIALATSGAGTSSMAVSGSQITGSLNFKAANGALVFETRVQLAALTNTSFFVGLTDATTLLMPTNSAASGNTVTTNQSNGGGFLFDTSNTAQTFLLTGVTADVDATVQVLTNAPVAATYNTLRIEVDTAGAALFYIDGVMVGSKMTGFTTATTALAPTVAIFERAAAVKTATCDYIYCHQDRV